MSENFITREEYGKTIGRLFDTVNNMEKTVERSSGIVERVCGTVDNMQKIIYGNGRDGLITKISNLFQQVGWTQRLLWIILASIIGFAFWAIRSRF